MKTDRPFYPHELVDPDLAWLLESYRERHPGMTVVDSSGLPVILVKSDITDLTEHLDAMTAKPEFSKLKALPAPASSTKGAPRS